MGRKKKHSIIETISEKLKLIPSLHDDNEPKIKPLSPTGTLTNYPPPEQWDDFVDYDPKSWPKKKKKHYSIVPTTCFNCESACGLLAYVDKEDESIRKFEGFQVSGRR